MNTMAAGHLLTLVCFLPTAGALLLLLLPERMAGEIKVTALVVALGDFALSLGLWFGFDPAVRGFQFAEHAAWIPAIGVSYSVGIDGISLLLVLLTTLLTPVALLFSVSHIHKSVRGFSIAFLVLETGMLGSLIATDLILFYFFWEVMLIPMYFIIGVWGGERRIYAAIKFFLFTMAGSLLMFLAILWLGIRLHQESGSWSFAFADIGTLRLPMNLQVILFLAFGLAFAIKVPIWPFHTWLPDAHTEAPTAGSIILAGVLLKLGVYGFLRFCLPLFPDAAIAFAPWIAGLGIAGIVLTSLIAYAQKDMKRLIAYTSVAHLGLVMLGIAVLTTTSLSGSLIQSVNHGLSTGALFLLVGVLYERRHTRDIAAYGGLARIVPVVTTLFVIATLASIGLPGLNGFVGEFLILAGTFAAHHRLWAFLGATTMVLSAVYMLTLVQRVFWNPVRHEENRNLPDIRPTEFIAAAALVVFMVWIGVAPNVFLDKIQTSVDALVEVVHARAAANRSGVPALARLRGSGEGAP
jgi:NADH-quinone oxidoreductase subunit M